MTSFDMSLRRKCILAAEDNEVNRIVLEHMLNEQPLPYLIVEDGAQAVDAFNALDPLLIFMDISMPVMDGIEAIEKIREAETGTGKRVPIVALTAHALSGDGKRVLDAGADHYLTKPVSLQTILERVLEVVEAGAANKSA